MTVEIWLRDSLDTEQVQGDLMTVMHELNMTHAQGKAFALLDSETGPMLVQLRLITKARELRDDSAIIGG